MKKLSIKSIVIAAVGLVTVLSLVLGASFFYMNSRASAANPADEVAGAHGHAIKVSPRTKGNAGNPNASGQFSCQNEGAPIRCYGPWQMRNAYSVQPLIDAGKDGTGSTIVIVDAFGSPTLQKDMDAFNAVFKLRNVTVNVVKPFGAPVFNPADANMVGWAFETSLDVQWAHAFAPGAKITLVVAKSNDDIDIYKALKYAVDHNLGDAISMSFGELESCVDPKLNAAQHAVFANAAKKGISLLASSGDQGAALPTCDGKSFVKGVSSPANDPLVVAVGGTQLFANTSTGKYDKEVTWNEVSTFGAAAGGGFSSIYKRPTYQNGTITNKGRGVADVSLNAAINGGVLVSFSVLSGKVGTFYIVGGTSASSPEWAGLVAIADQIHHGRIGDFHDDLYEIGHSKNYSKAFHDITVGNNTFAFKDSGGTVHVITGYAAAKGWDPATGWGSAVASVLIPLLAD